jgi:SLOG in TRPM, prokaryote
VSTVLDLNVETIQFRNGNQARAVYVPEGAAVQRVIDALQLPRPRALLVLNGGTAELRADLQTQLGRLLQDGLARTAADEQLTLLTGGTDSGIFALLGQGIAKAGRTAPCTGVAVDGLVTWPGANPRRSGQNRVPLEPHHSHFALVAGEHWGDETALMYALTTALGDGLPSIAVIASGGAVARNEVLINVRQGRELIVIAGSGRFADELASVLRGEAKPADMGVEEIVRDGRITLYEIHQPATALADLLRRKVRTR